MFFVLLKRGADVYGTTYRYIEQNEPQSANALHILNNKYQYGSINNIMSLLKRGNKDPHYWIPFNSFTSNRFPIRTNLFRNKPQQNETRYISWHLTVTLRHAGTWLRSVGLSSNLHSTPQSHQHIRTNRLLKLLARSATVLLYLISRHLYYTSLIFTFLINQFYGVITVMTNIILNYSS